MKSFLFLAVAAVALTSNVSKAEVGEQIKTAYAYSYATIITPVSYKIVSKNQEEKIVKYDSKKEICFNSKLEELHGLTYDFTALDKIKNQFCKRKIKMTASSCQNFAEKSNDMAGNPIESTTSPELIYLSFGGWNDLRIDCAE